MENTPLSNSQNPDNLKNTIFMGSNGVITGLFTNIHTAEAVYKSLIDTDYKEEEITLAMSEATQNSFHENYQENVATSDTGTKSTEGLGIGAAIGGSIGAIAAAIAAVGTSLIIPGLGIVIAGSLAAGLAGAGAGAATGGLVGALVGSGIPDDQAKLLQAGIENGGIIIGIKTSSDEERNELYEQWSDAQNRDSANLIYS